MAEIRMQGGNRLNNVEKGNNPKHSRFVVKRPLALTARFGEITPFMCETIVPDDKARSFRSKIDLRTFTLKSPMMQDLTMHKNYFQVPWECILPFNWKSKIYPNPNLGDDVPQDAYCYGDYGGMVQSLVDYNWPSVSEFGQLDLNKKQMVFSLLYSNLTVLENIFSSGSLANILGYGIRRFDVGVPDVSSLSSFTNIRVLSSDGQTVYQYKMASLSNHAVRSLANDYIFVFEFSNQPSVGTVYQSLLTCFAIYKSFIEQTLGDSISDYFSFDLSRLLAYQLVCAHYYSNDKVDFVYSSDLWRENVASLYEIVQNAVTFNYNGSSIPYDWFSYFCLSEAAFLFSRSTSNLPGFALSSGQFLFWNQIFGFRRSLKFEDYFTGARTRPLAIGNTSVPVVGQAVDVVDISRNIQGQRFLNSINRFGRKFSNYIEGLFDVVPEQDWHDPKFISSSSEVVYGQETENTGEVQFTEKNNITTNLISHSNNFEFSADFDRPSILLGLLSFDIVRYYTNATDRMTLIKDRFDMFNPFMQYIGDQKLLAKEFDRDCVSTGADSDSAFGYSTRFIEYKLGFPRAVGAFASGDLPSWIFDNQDLVSAGVPHVYPEFIRSLPSELDKYYLNGTGSKMCDYFHFIINVVNELTIDRPMAVNPQILG